jgi:hypothetical protein
VEDGESEMRLWKVGGFAVTVSEKTSPVSGTWPPARFVAEYKAIVAVNGRDDP